jgi:hypothetical protein
MEKTGTNNNPIKRGLYLTSIPVEECDSIRNGMPILTFKMENIFLCNDVHIGHTLVCSAQLMFYSNPLSRSFVPFLAYFPYFEKIK